MRSVLRVMVLSTLMVTLVSACSNSPNSAQNQAQSSKDGGAKQGLPVAVPEVPASKDNPKEDSSKEGSNPAPTPTPAPTPAPEPPTLNPPSSDAKWEGEVRTVKGKDLGLWYVDGERQEWYSPKGATNKLDGFVFDPKTPHTDTATYCLGSVLTTNSVSQSVKVPVVCRLSKLSQGTCEENKPVDCYNDTSVHSEGRFYFESPQVPQLSKDQLQEQRRTQTLQLFQESKKLLKLVRSVVTVKKIQDREVSKKIKKDSLYQFLTNKKNMYGENLVAKCAFIPQTTYELITDDSLDPVVTVKTDFDRCGNQILEFSYVDAPKKNGSILVLLDQDASRRLVELLSGKLN